MSAAACCWNQFLSFSPGCCYATSPELSRLYHGLLWERILSSYSRAGCLWKLCLERLNHLCWRDFHETSGTSDTISDILPRWGSVTVTELLEPVWRVASLWTSTLAGLKSSGRFCRRKKSSKLAKLKMWQIAETKCWNFKKIDSHFSVWNTALALGLVKLAPSFSSLISWPRSIR